MQEIAELVDIEKYRDHYFNIDEGANKDNFDWFRHNDKFARIVTLLSMHPKGDAVYKLLLMLMTDLEFFYEVKNNELLKKIKKLEGEIEMFKVNRDNKFEEGTYLKAGGYVATIRAAKVDSTGLKLAVRFDISEGELKDLFKNEYDSNPSNGWNKKGIVNFDLNNQYGEQFVNQFIDCVEKSNDSYLWDGDEKKLVNKKIGVVYEKNTYTNKDGEIKNGTSFPKFKSVKDIRDGNFSIEENAKNKQSKQVESATNTFNISEDDIQF